MLRYLTATAAGLCCFIMLLPKGVSAEQYKAYAFDDAPLKKHSKAAEEWQKLRTDGFEKPSTEASLKRQLELIEGIAKTETQWIDGYWLASESAFLLGNSYSDPKDLKKARDVFIKGRSWAEDCVKKAPDNPLCKLFLGAAIGKIASIDGIFSSLKNAKRVESLWLEASQSGVNYNLSPTSSLQGNLNYALGLFYRLVPDFFLTDWLFGVKGDIKKSIHFHEQSVKIDPPNSCTQMMLGVALICAGKAKSRSEETKQGLKALAEAKQLPVKNTAAFNCAKDIPRIEADPRLACGYETSRQQETSEEEFNKLHKPSP